MAKVITTNLNYRPVVEMVNCELCDSTYTFNLRDVFILPTPKGQKYMVRCPNCGNFHEVSNISKFTNKNCFIH